MCTGQCGHHHLFYFETNDCCRIVAVFKARNFHHERYVNVSVLDAPNSRHPAAIKDVYEAESVDDGTGRERHHARDRIIALAANAY